MKKFGLIGGMSWSSTARYYQIINEGVARRLGNLHSAPLIIESLDFAEVVRCTTAEDWDAAATKMIAAAQRLEAAGAQGLAICANSMYTVYDRITANVTIPVLHIADAVGKQMRSDGIKSAALIGTSNVMAEKFYRQRLVAHGISLSPPDMALAARIDRIVYDELLLGKATGEAKRFMKSELTGIAKNHAQAAVLACTELEAIVDVRANVLPIYDSAPIHAEAALEFILSE